MTIGKTTMGSCFILVYKNKDVGDTLALIEKTEDDLVFSIGALEQTGHTVLYALSVFDGAVTRYN